MSDIAMKYEDWLRGCVHHDGRKGNVYLPCDIVLAIADWIEAHRDAVSVVRCKDCVHGSDRTDDFQEEDERWDVVNPIACMMYSSDGEPDFFPKDNYCGFGERKGELGETD